MRTLGDEDCERGRSEASRAAFRSAVQGAVILAAAWLLVPFALVFVVLLLPVAVIAAGMVLLERLFGSGEGRDGAELRSAE